MEAMIDKAAPAERRELVRQFLWIRVVAAMSPVSLADDCNSSDACKWADDTLKHFDRTFKKPSGE